MDKFISLLGITIADRAIMQRSEQRSSLANPPQWFLDSFGITNKSGQPVNERTAMSLAPVHACVRVISEGLSSMPLKLYEQKDNQKIIDKVSQVAKLLEEPNPFSTGVSFRKFMTAVAVLHGNSYAYIFRNNSGTPINLLPLQNCKVTPVLQSGGLYYQIDTSDPIYAGIPKVVSNYDILHFKGLCIKDQFTALSPIVYHAETLGIDLAAMAALAGNFKTGTKKWMLNSDKPWGIDQQNNTKASMESVLNSDSLVFTVPTGIAAQTISMTPTEAGYLEAIGATAKDIARMFGVPASIIGADDGAIKASVEQDSLNFLSQTLHPWAVNIEAELKMKLLAEREKPFKFFKHNFNSLMRADATSRATFYSQMLNVGAMSPNEIREYEDFNPYDGGDTRYVQVNLMPAAQATELTQAKIDNLEKTTINNPQGNN